MLSEGHALLSALLTDFLFLPSYKLSMHRESPQTSNLVCQFLRFDFRARSLVCILTAQSEEQFSLCSTPRCRRYAMAVVASLVPQHRDYLNMVVQALSNLHFFGAAAKYSLQ